MNLIRKRGENNGDLEASNHLLTAQVRIVSCIMFTSNFVKAGTAKVISREDKVRERAISLRMFCLAVLHFLIIPIEVQ